MKKGVSNLMTIIVSTVLIVASLVILYFFFSGLNTTDNIDKQACRLSVETRAAYNLGVLFEPGKEAIKLNCKTEKICVSDSEEYCDDSPGFKESESNPIKKIEIGSQDPQTAVLDAISESMFDCHSMLGEGELNFLPSRWSSQNYCLICSRIATDSETRNQLGEVSYMKLYQHLQQKQTPQGQSYLEFIYGARSSREMADILENIKEQINKETGKETISSIDEFKIDLKHINGNAIIVQMSPKGTWNEWLGLSSGTIGAVTIVGAIVAAPFTGGLSLSTIGVGAALLGVGAGTGLKDWGGTILDDEDRITLGSGPIISTETSDGTKYSRPTLYSYNTEVLRGLNCNSFELAP